MTILRHTALLVVFALILGSGRLLACGWECNDRHVATQDTACHESAAVDGLALSASAHACAPDLVEPAVAVKKTAVTHAPVGSPPFVVASALSHAPPTAGFISRRPPGQLPASCSRPISVLRI